MDAATFLKGRRPLAGTSGDLTNPPGQSVSLESAFPSDEPFDSALVPASGTVYRDTTPSGIVVEYQSEPKRLYRVNGTEVPSVTTVLDALAKDGLKWWGMKVGVEGVLELFNRNKLAQMVQWDDDAITKLVLWAKGEPETGMPVAIEPTVDNVTSVLTEEKLTVNHVLNRAADRGTNVHDALEQWARSGGEFFPTLVNFPEEEQGYVRGLGEWIDALGIYGRPALCEVMVGSTEYGYAGRYDLVVEITETMKFISRAYKRKAPLTVDVAPGRYLVDLKTSKSVYPGSHFRQLAAYELASIECGYPATDGQFVLHVTADGAYEFVPSTATPEDFLAVLEVYKSNKRLG